MNRGTHIGWAKQKPELNQECLLLTASVIMSRHAKHGYYWSYKLFEITQIPSDEGWYWGVLQDSEEWGDIADISADLYKVIPLSHQGENQRASVATDEDQGVAADTQIIDLQSQISNLSANYMVCRADRDGLRKENTDLLAEVERLRGEREALRIAAEALLNGLSKEHNSGQPIPRSIHVILKIKALKEVLNPKP